MKVEYDPHTDTLTLLLRETTYRTLLLKAVFMFDSKVGIPTLKV
jgi:uncharacterized protein YuzE